MDHTLPTGRRLGAAVLALSLLSLGLAVAGTPSADAGSRLSNANLSGVSCPSTTFCVMAGAYNGSSTAPSALVEIWDNAAHTWTTRIRNVVSDYTSVSCASTTHCAAAGWQQVSGKHVPLVDTWNGTTWTSLVLPHTAGQDTELAGISCPATTMCMAVGEEGGTVSKQFGERATVELFAKGVWSQAFFAAGDESPEILEGVSCPSLSDCVTVGNAYPWREIEHWTGAGWVRHNDAQPDGVDLRSVDCTLVGECLAVGDNTFDSRAAQEHGSTWGGDVLMALPPHAADDYAKSVSCGGSSACAAVGFYEGGDTPLYSAFWDGSTWTTKRAVDPAGTTGGTFSGVSCAAPSSCVAVGASQSGSTRLTMAQQWNGTSWTQLAPR